MPTNKIEAAIKALKECEWVEADSSDGYSHGESGFDCDDASAFLTNHCDTILEALRVMEKKQTQSVSFEQILAAETAETLTYKFADGNDTEDYPFNGEEYDIKLVNFAYDWLLGWLDNMKEDIENGNLPKPPASDYEIELAIKDMPDSNADKFTIWDWFVGNYEAIKRGLKRPDTINNDDCIKPKNIVKEWQAVWESRNNPELSFKDLDYFEAFAEWLINEGIISKNPVPNLTQDDPCVRDALEALDDIERGYRHQFNLDEKEAEEFQTIRTALLAKQPDKCPLGDDCDLTIAYMKGVEDSKPDAEKLKQVDEALNAAIDDNETSTGRLQNIHIARNLLRSVLREVMVV